MHIETKILKRDYHRTAYLTIHKDITVVERSWDGTPVIGKNGKPKRATITVDRRGPRKTGAPSLRQYARTHRYGKAWLARKRGK